MVAATGRNAKSRKYNQMRNVLCVSSSLMYDEINYSSPNAAITFKLTATNSTSSIILTSGNLTDIGWPQST